GQGAEPEAPRGGSGPLLAPATTAEILEVGVVGRAGEQRLHARAGRGLGGQLLPQLLAAKLEGDGLGRTRLDALELADAEVAHALAAKACDERRLRPGREQREGGDDGLLRQAQRSGDPRTECL